MLEKMFEVLGNLTVLSGMIPVIRDTVSFRKITVRVCDSVVPKRFSGKTLFKLANNIWVLGKNNLDSLGGTCPLLPIRASSSPATSDCSQNGSRPTLALKEARFR
jgi:hypothetical protein